MLAVNTQMEAESYRLWLAIFSGDRMALRSKRFVEFWKERDRSCSSLDYLTHAGSTQPLRSVRFETPSIRLTATRPRTFFDKVPIPLAN